MACRRSCKTYLSPGIDSWITPDMGQVFKTLQIQMGLGLVPFIWHPQNGKADVLHTVFEEAFGCFELILHGLRNASPWV